MNNEQLKIYNSYLDKGFNEEQLYEIRKGIEEENDISAFARIKMPASEMAHIRKTQNFKKSLRKVSEQEKKKPLKEVEVVQEEKTDIRTKNEKLADVAITLGETSIVMAIISLLLIMLGII